MNHLSTSTEPSHFDATTFQRWVEAVHMEMQRAWEKGVTEIYQHRNATLCQLNLHSLTVMWMVSAEERDRYNIAEHEAESRSAFERLKELVASTVMCVACVAEVRQRCVVAAQEIETTYAACGIK